MEKINFNISKEKELIPVGSIKYYSGASFDYFSEQKMLDDYSSTLNTKGFHGIKGYTISPKGLKERHGLQYEMKRALMKDFGIVFTKEDYILFLEYKKAEERECMFNKKYNPVIEERI